MESLTGALGIAYLTPTAEASRFVRRPGDALRGYALINGEEERLSLSLWVENGRPLQDRTGRDGFYYEAWLGDLSVGPFNADPTGHGALTTTVALGTERPAWPTGAPPALSALAEQFQGALPATLSVRVTVEPFGGTPSGGIPVLTGPIIWLGAVDSQREEDATQEALSLSGAPSLGESPDSDLEADVEVLTPEAALEPAVAAAEAGEATSDEGATTVAPEGSAWANPLAVNPFTVNPFTVNPFAANPTAANPFAGLASPTAANPFAGIPTTGPSATRERTPPASAPAAGKRAPAVDPSTVKPSATVSPSASPYFAPTPSTDNPAADAVAETIPADATPTEAAPPSTEVPEATLPSPEEQLATHLDQNLIVTRRPLIRPLEPEPNRLSPRFKVISVHPLAKRVHAGGTLDAELGALTLQVRSLPSPSVLGTSEATGRPWSAYRVWLTHSRTGAAHSVGLLNRGLVDQWRLEVPEGLPLPRFDTLLVCLDDRTTPQPKPEPIVLQGSLLV